ncbi:MAG: hypothetical protein CXZ00_15075 [Acidobacteria bacterium]|nr:MAG: hypothetical protein CXZ00_15075 [Acidobacteriota bacterium]
MADHDAHDRQPGIARSVVWSYVGYAADIVAGILLLGYVVRRVPPAEYGLLSLAGALSMLLYLLDLGLFNILVQKYVEIMEAQDKDKLEALLSTTLFGLAGLGSIGMGIFLAVAFCLPGPFKIPPEYLKETRVVFILMGVVVQIGLPTTALEQLYQAFRRFDRINQIQLLTAAIRVAFTILILTTGHGIVALAGLQVLMAIARIVMLWLFLPSSGIGIQLKLMFDWNLLKPLLRSGGWAWAENISRQLATVSDLAILGMFSSMNAVAMFGVGSKLPMHVSSAVSRGALVVLPALSRRQQRTSELQRIYTQTLALVLGGVLPIVVLGCVCARPLIRVWAGDAYLGAAPVMQWLLLAALSLAIEHPSDLLLYGRGHVKIAARIAIFESFTNIVVSLLLVSRYGAAGLAAGTALTHLLINAFWYTPAACRAARLSPRMLISAALHRLGWPSLLLILGIVFVRLLLLFGFAPQVVVMAGVASGLAYVAVWGFRIVMPLLRTPMMQSID